MVLQRFWISMASIHIELDAMDQNEFKVSHRKQVNAPSNMNMATSLMDFECQPCGIFEVILGP